MFGLTEDAMLKILMEDVRKNRNSEVYMGDILETLIPNIVEVIAANNEAILFQLKDESSEYDSKY